MTEKSTSQYTREEYQQIRTVSIDVLKEFIRICDKYDLGYFAAFGTAIGAARHQGFIPWDDDIDVGMLRVDYDKFMAIAPQEMADKYDIYSAPIQKDIKGFYAQMFLKDTLFVTQANMMWQRHTGIKIDIFPYDNIPKSKGERKKLYKQLHFWNRLYIIRNTKVPFFAENNLVTKLTRTICKVAYVVMEICGPSIDRIIAKYVSLMTKYKEDTKVYTVMDDLTQDWWYLKREEIFPLKEMQFEDIKVKVPNKNHEILTRQYGDYMTPPPKEQQRGHDVVILKGLKE